MRHSVTELEAAAVRLNASRPVTPISDRWQDRLIKSDNGKPKPLLANAIAALTYAPEWAGVLAFNSFTYEITMTAAAPCGGAGGSAWSDTSDARTAEWLQHQGILVTREIAGQAVETVAEARRYHPVREYLDSLEWDKTRRLDGWLWLYIGVDQGSYACTVGSRWLVQAVARIYRPGWKADSCLILEGPQGIKKSTSLQTLFEPWFTDNISDFGSKDAAVESRGVWCFELAELDSLNRSESSRVKAFLSKTTEHFRPPYGRRAIWCPRQCVFAGTGNHHEYLKDETGARRFWPVRCGLIDIDELKANRDQLWVEARDRFKSGSVWWLDSPELNREAAEQQAERFDADVWQGLIAEWLESRNDSSVEEVLTRAVQKAAEHQTQGDKNRVARCLRALGWERYNAGRRDAREWRYRRVFQ